MIIGKIISDSVKPNPAERKICFHKLLEPLLREILYAGGQQRCSGRSRESVRSDWVVIGQRQLPCEGCCGKRQRAHEGSAVHHSPRRCCPTFTTFRDRGITRHGWGAGADAPPFELAKLLDPNEKVMKAVVSAPFGRF